MMNRGSWAVPSHGVQKIPKVREYARIKMMNEEVLTGYVFVEATSRIQDVLNGANRFIPFVDENDEILLLNTASIMQLKPLDT